MIYIEPAPYVVGLVNEIRSIWVDQVDVAYVTPFFTQNWGYVPASPADKVLPARSTKAIAEIWQLLKSEMYSAVHLAGWGHPVLLSALLLAGSLRIPVAVETDTQLPRSQSVWKSIVKRVLQS